MNYYQQKKKQQMIKYIVDDYALRSLIESDLRLKALEIGGVLKWTLYDEALSHDIPPNETIMDYYERVSLEHLNDYEQLISNNGE